MRNSANTVLFQQPLLLGRRSEEQDVRCEEYIGGFKRALKHYLALARQRSKFHPRYAARAYDNDINYFFFDRIRCVEFLWL
jgi:hypothetical protein